MTNLIGRTAEEIQSLLEPHVDRAFRSRQVAHWILQRHASSFEEMTNLPASLRREFRENFVLHDPDVLAVHQSKDGSEKYLFELADGTTVEGVVMPEGRKLTLCLSSQTGCAVGCTFCVTGALGSGRNLGPDEIVGLYRVMLKDRKTERVNIVFMGMGEPLLNTTHLETSLEVLYERVSPKRITVSTAGILPGIRWLAGLARRPKLAVSLNAPDQNRRRLIMPIAERYPLDELMIELKRFPLERGRRITFEYVVIRDFNDGIDDALQLAALVRGIPCKVNVIPLNEDSHYLPDLRQPDSGAVDRFGRALRDAGLTATVRWSKGRDVAAACGQLKGRHQSRSANT
jgi:23S rRNA (adenine2503-C2)-methyltransferase